MARHRSGLSFRLSLALAVMAAVCATSSAQQQPPPQAVPSCPPAQASLSSCVSYFIGNSSSPSAECCSQIQAMFQSQAPCLCATVLGPVLGQAQGLLPGTCNLPPNACAGASSAPAGGSTAPSSGTTVAAPVIGPSSGTTAAAPVTGPSGAVPAAPSGGGLKSVPALLGSAAAGRHGCISAAAISISFLVACIL